MAFQQMSQQEYQRTTGVSSNAQNQNSVLGNVASIAGKVGQSLFPQTSQVVQQHQQGNTSGGFGQALKQGAESIPPVYAAMHPGSAAELASYAIPGGKFGEGVLKSPMISGAIRGGIKPLSEGAGKIGSDIQSGNFGQIGSDALSTLGNTAVGAGTGMVMESGITKALDTLAPTLFGKVLPSQQAVNKSTARKTSEAVKTGLDETSGLTVSQIGKSMEKRITDLQGQIKSAVKGVTDKINYDIGNNPFVDKISQSIKDITGYNAKDSAWSAAEKQVDKVIRNAGKTVQLAGKQATTHTAENLLEAQQAISNKINWKSLNSNDASVPDKVFKAAYDALGSKIDEVTKGVTQPINKTLSQLHSFEPAIARHLGGGSTGMGMNPVSILMRKLNIIDPMFLAGARTANSSVVKGGVSKLATDAASKDVKGNEIPALIKMLTGGQSQGSAEFGGPQQ